MPSPSARISGSSPKAFIWTKSTINRRVSELRSSSTVYILPLYEGVELFDACFDQLVNFAEVDVGVGHAVGPAELVLIEDFLQRHVLDLEEICRTRQIAQVVIRVAED